MFVDGRFAVSIRTLCEAGHMAGLIWTDCCNNGGNFASAVDFLKDQSTYVPLQQLISAVHRMLSFIDP